MRRVLDDLAHGRIHQAVARPVRLHGAAVVARDAGRIKGHPDVALVILDDLLHARGWQRKRLSAGREMGKRKFLRAAGERRCDQQEQQAGPHTVSVARGGPGRLPN
jgi:hypothetical protein